MLNELEDAGYLRAEPISDLRIKYEEWLYKQIMDVLHFKSQTESTARRIILEEENRIAEEHRKAIN